MTKEDKVRLVLAAGASLAAITYFVFTDHLLPAAGIALLSAGALFIGGRKW